MKSTDETISSEQETQFNENSLYEPNNSMFDPIEEGAERIDGIPLSIMMTKSFIGIGIFSLPSVAPRVGFIGFIALYSIVSILTVWFSLLLVQVANRIGYTGYSFGELFERILSRRFRIIPEIGTFLNCLGAAVGQVYLPSTPIFNSSLDQYRDIVQIESLILL